MKNAEKINNWDLGCEERFRSLALRYVEIGAQEGIKIVPYVDPAMKLFHRASPERQQSATELLQMIVDIHEDSLQHKESPAKAKQVIWRALKKLSFNSEADLLDHFSDEDVTVIYDTTQTAIFWNLNTFKFFSLTVEQLFFDQWFNFTKRDPAYLDRLIQMMMRVTAGTITGHFTSNVPPHRVEEVGTLENLVTEMDVHFGSTLKKHGELAGIFIAQRMRLLPA